MHPAATDGTPTRRARCHSLLLIVLLSLGGICAGPASSRSDTLALFDFTTNVVSSDTDPNSSATFVRWNIDGRGIDTNDGNPAPSAGNNTTYSTLGDARTNDQVFQFTLAPDSGYTISLSSVSFDIAAEKTPASSTDQTGHVFIYTSRDGQNTPVAAGSATDTTSDFDPSAFANWSSNNLSGNALYQNVAEPITFSLYVYGSHPDHLVYFDNIRVEGVAAAVPEPSSFALLAFGLLVTAGYVVRRASGDSRSRPVANRG